MDWLDLLPVQGTLKTLLTGFQGIWGDGFGHVLLGYIRFSEKLVGVLG